MTIEIISETLESVAETVEEIAETAVTSVSEASAATTEVVSNDIFSAIAKLFLSDGLIIVLACLVIGMVIKGTFDKIPNKYIPLINAGVGIIISVALGAFSSEGIASQIVKGIILGGSSTWVYEVLTVIVSKRFSIDLGSIGKKINKNQSDNDKKGS